MLWERLEVKGHKDPRIGPQIKAQEFATKIAIAKWLDCEWLQKILNEGTPPTLQTFGTSV